MHPLKGWLASQGDQFVASVRQWSAAGRRRAGGLLFASRGIHDLTALATAAFCVLALDERSTFEPIGNAIVAAHMRASPLPASGAIVFVAIDTRSVNAIGSWPWSREVHAALIRELLDQGATEVFLDVDLSTPTTPEEDADLALALAEAGGSVLLPAFRQQRGVGVEGVAANLPLKEFRAAAWVGAVNLTADRDGIVRRYPYATLIDDENMPSAAALLSGVFGTAGSEFFINFALDPATVPAISAIDVLDGTADIDLAGKSVVVGGHALELRDALTVPVHGPLAGSMIQILAAETLAQGLVLRTFNPYAAIAMVGFVALALMRVSPGRPTLGLSLLAVSAAAVAGLAYWLQSKHAIILPEPMLLSMLAAAAVVFATREFGLRRRLLQLARVESSNMELILERVIADSTDAVIVADERLSVLRISQSARLLFDVPRATGRHSRLAEIVPEEMVAAALKAVAAVDGRMAPVRQSLSFEMHGEPRWIEYLAKPSRLWRTEEGERGEDTGTIVCLTARDVTTERNHHARIDRLARLDSLTGALNRTEFVSRLAARVADGAEGCAVITFNLHRLTTVNATLGRLLGDKLLVAVVERINETGLDISPLARVGGDRFAVYTLAGTTPEDVARITDRILRLIRAPFQLDGQVVRITLRAGVAEGAVGDDADSLLGKAELALDEARLRDGPGVRTFDQESFARQARTRNIERAHWTALSEEEMYLAYQPQVRLSDGRPIGAEALCRWSNPTLGAISPSEFVGIAEGSGFIEHLGRWVLETACIDAQEWPEEMSVSVNVSPSQFHCSDVVADVERALAVSGLAAHRLYLEITESLFLDGSKTFSDTFAGLRGLGVSLALDDFGTGYSSYGHLAGLPLDKLKVDRMFVQGLDLMPFNQAVIRSIVSLCHEIGLTVICEGVETAEQAELLRMLGCEEAQGFLFGRPERQAALIERLHQLGAKARGAAGS